MLKSILTSLRSADLRKKLLFTAFILAVYRFGSYVPTPGVDLDTLQAAIDQRGSRLLDFLNLFAGGALTRFAVFARSTSSGPGSPSIPKNEVINEVR